MIIIKIVKLNDIFHYWLTYQIGNHYRLKKITSKIRGDSFKICIKYDRHVKQKIRKRGSIAVIPNNYSNVRWWSRARYRSNSWFTCYSACYNNLLAT